MPENTKSIEPASNVGKPFNFDSAAFLNARQDPSPVSLDPIQEDSLVAKAKQRIDSLLSGELPDEVLQQVEIRAAEKGQKAGLTGEANRNLTFRDLGSSAMDAISAGMQATGQMEALRLDREKANKACTCIP